MRCYRANIAFSSSSVFIPVGAAQESSSRALAILRQDVIADNARDDVSIVLVLTSVALLLYMLTMLMLTLTLSCVAYVCDPTLAVRRGVKPLR